MDEEEYTKQLIEISKLTHNKLAYLQEGLTLEQLKEFAPLMSFFFVNLIESAVGKEDLVTYMIELLNVSNRIATNEKESNKRQLDRYKDIKEKNKDLI